MGTRRRPKPAGRAKMTVLAATAGAASLFPAIAHAEPGQSIDQVKAQVDKLNEDAESATEQYDKAQDEQRRLQADASTLQDRLAAQQEKINKIQGILGAVASQEYRDGGIDPSLQLILSNSPEQYLQRASQQNQASGRLANALREAQLLQRTMNQERAETAGKLAELDQTRTAMAAKKTEVQAKLAQAQSILNGLKAADRAKVLADSDGNGQAASRSSNRPSTYNGPASGRVKAVLDFAYAQLGKPYQWGATGPGSFDCSGLTQAAWRAGGISLPRVSQDQWNAGNHVAKSDLQPGDLVFYFSDLHHVGIYIGNGQILHAPRTGEDVRIVGLDVMPYMGAVRP
ncbi:NlpC/P60 family protein [Kitasatospora sp. HPMI-4]|uniref:C40 family peptidase n=1 Tax=Kitasatospora sp. HPMI-4 TaxID=3448443 RepID=UPI003F1C0C16